MRGEDGTWMAMSPPALASFRAATAGLAPKPAARFAALAAPPRGWTRWWCPAAAPATPGLGRRRAGVSPFLAGALVLLAALGLWLRPRRLFRRDHLWDYTTKVITHGLLGHKEEELDRKELEAAMNELGAQGFELATAFLDVALRREEDGHVLVFKRRHRSSSDGAVRAMSDAVLAIAGERSVDAVLQRIVHVARELVDASYAAIGVPSEDGEFARFVTSGMTAEQVAAMGPLPRTHGLLGATLGPPSPTHPRHQARPALSRLVAVGASGDGLVPRRPHRRPREGGGRLLPDRQAGRPAVHVEDQALIELLAPHAAVAMENAWLHERSRELSIVEERNRLARELHDSVVQKLFGMVLAAESAATLLEREPGDARPRSSASASWPGRDRGAARDRAPAAPGGAESEGLATALRKHVEVLRRVHSVDVGLELSGAPRLRPGVDEEVFRIAQEALHNALRHARADAITVRLDERDDGADARGERRRQRIRPRGG